MWNWPESLLTHPDSCPTNGVHLTMLYDLMPNMPDQQLAPLVERFAAMLAEQPVFHNTFAAI